MTLKEIIVDKLIFGFKQNKPKWWDYEAYLRFIEPIIRGAVNSVTSNITTTDNWQVIASGEIILDVDDVFISFPIIRNVEGLYSLGHINSSLFGKYIGKSIEIAVRVKDRPNEWKSIKSFHVKG